MGTEYQALVYGVGCGIEGLKGYKAALKRYAGEKDPRYALYEAFEEVIPGIEDLHRVFFYGGYECPPYIGIVLRATNGVFGSRKRHVLPFPRTWDRGCIEVSKLPEVLEGMVTSSAKARAEAAWYAMRVELNRLGLVLPFAELRMVNDCI